MGKLLKILPPALAGLALVVLMLWMAGVIFQGEQISPGVKEGRSGLPAPSNTQSVETVQKSAWYEAVGTVRSRIQATVAPQITGQLLDVKVDAGDPVTAGQVLVTLDSQEYLARFEQARSALVAAEAGKEQAESNFQRIKSLLEQKAATPEQMEAAESQKKQADAGVMAAEQRVKEAETFLGYTRLVSPLDGVVADRLADPGDLAYPGKALLVLHKPEDLRLEASVREGLIQRVSGYQESGREVEVHIAALDRTVRGTIGEIVPSADPVSRSFLVKVALPRGEGLYPGMFGKLRIELDPRPTVLVPAGAVNRVGQLVTILVLDAGRWVRRFVTLGAPSGELVEVLSGLTAGETIGWN